MEEMKMKTKKKNKFWTFCFSLIPGAAEMYMGFMKTGISLMLLFFLILLIGSWIGQGVFAFLGIAVWFYGFFHANHLASLSDEDFAQVEDRYLYEIESLPGAEKLAKKYHKLLAAILIFLGICLLWSNAADMLYQLLPKEYEIIPRIMWEIGNYLPSFVFGVLIIGAGIKLLAGKKVTEAPSLEEQERNTEQGEGK